MYSRLLFSVILFFGAFSLSVFSANAASVTWVGASGDWETGANWSSGIQPTADDDVTIDASVTVSVNATTTVNSLIVGSSTGGTAAILNFDYNAITGGALILDAGDLTVYPNAMVTHTAGTASVLGTVYFDVQTGNAVIHPNGAINVSTKGYLQGEGPGEGTNAANPPSGAGYGGYGGSGTSVAGGITYGSITAPVDLGSGGGIISSSAGDGGGAIRMNVVGTFTMNGSLNANGEDGNPAAGAASRTGGSGGSIYLDVGTLAGTGTITSNGGASNASGGGGGGGRIALYYTTDSSSLATLSAYGGAMESADNPNFGGAGTIYKKADGSSNGDLIIDNNFQDAGQNDRFMGKTPVTGTFTFETLTVKSRAHMVLHADSVIAYTTLNWSSSGTIQDDSAGTFALVTGGGSLTIPSTAQLYAHTNRTFTTGTVTGALTHGTSSATADHRINLTFSTLTIEPEGSVAANGKGHYRGEGPGAGVDTTLTPGGGGYGGYGGTGTSVAGGGITYGSITTPIDPGSGGGLVSSGEAGDGGGAVQLTVSGTLTVNGSLNANGDDGDSSAGASSRAGGSGGSVYLNVGTLAGTGSITANGGASNASGGAGGGGRIALLYTTDSSTLAALSAYGGAWESAIDPNFGGAGTIYKKAAAATNGDLIIDNNFQDALQEDRYIGKTPLTGTFTFDTLTVKSRAHMVLHADSVITYSTFNWSSSGTIEDNSAGTFALLTSGSASLTVPVTSRYYAHTSRTFADGTIGGSVTHAGNGAAVDYRMNLTFSSLTVEPNGSIDVSGKGYPQGEGPGQGTDTTGSPGGAGHGGFGASGSVAGGITYGSITAPVDAGSGGGEISSSAGDGGGIVQLTVSGTMTINGSLDADGIDGDSGAGAASRAGGSGGSVYLNVGTLAGTGSITSSGGASNASGGAGGGGRIALLYTTDSSAFATLGAYGGAMESASLPNFGGAGTIYKKAAAATNGDLIIDNNFRDALQDDSWIGKTPLTGTFTFDTLTVKSRGQMVLKPDSVITYSTLNWSSSGTIEDSSAGTFALITGGGALTVPSTARYVANTSRTFSSVSIDGTLTHSKNTYSENYKVYLVTTGDFTLNGGGAISLDDLGFVSATGTGAGADAGTYGSGAGHGGTGGVTSDGSSTGGAAYDSETGPVHIGSGGGNSTTTVDGGDGGGAVYISVGGSMTLNGDVSANGESTTTAAGGGSGGSIWLAIVGNLTGTGNLYAKGGSGGSSNPGAGAGGRIAITCTGHTWTGTGDVTAGVQGKTADTGTIYTTLCPQISNSAPTVTGVSAVQTTNGSGDVVIVFTIDDADDDNTVQAKIEYNVGGGASDPTISTTGSETSATYGDPGVNNSATYQIGTSGAYIVTSSGANTITTVWESATDAPSANTLSALITITPYDGTAAGSSTNLSFSLDNVAPTITGLTYNTSSQASSETISGTTEASATVYSNSTYVTTADGSGNFSFVRNLASGINSFVIYTIDAKGNVSNSTVATITTPGSGSSGSSVPSGESMAGDDEEDTEEPTEEEPGEEVPEELPEEEPVEEDEEDSGEETPEEETDGEEGSSSGGSEVPVEESDEDAEDDKITIIDAIFGGENTQSNVPLISVAQQIKPKNPSKFTIKLFLSHRFGELTKAGIPKPLIRRYFGNIKNFKADRDTDGDEATDGQELVYGSNPLVGDTDGDGVSDSDELVDGTYPFTWDSDGDGISDKNDANPNLYQYNPVSQEEMDDYIKKYGIVLGDGETLGTIDSDEDGLSDLQELEMDTDPQVGDSDGDSYLDGEEVLNYATDPNTASRPTGIALANAGVNQLVEDGNQFLIGRSEENSEVFAYAVDAEGDTQLLGETVTDEEGKFAVYTNGLAAGTYDLVVVQTDGKRDVVDISYPITFVVSAEDLVEEPVMKRLGEKLVINNTTIIATWDSVLLGMGNSTELVDSGIQLMVGQASDPNSTVELRAILADGTDQFLGQVMSDAMGKYVLFAQVPVEGDYAIYAYTKNTEGRIVDTSFPLLINVEKDEEYVVSKDGVMQLDYKDSLKLESIAVEENTTVVTTWTSLVLSSTLVTDSSGQSFDVDSPRPLEGGRHAVTTYVMDRQSGERSEPVRVEFDVVQAGVIAPALSEEGNDFTWIILAALAVALLGGIGFVSYRRRK